MMELLKCLFTDIRECRIPWQALRVMTYIAAHHKDGCIRLSQRALRPFCNVSNRFVEASIKGLIELDYLRPLTDAAGKLVPGMFGLGWRTVKYQNRCQLNSTAPHGDTPEYHFDIVEQHPPSPQKGGDTPEQHNDTVEYHPPPPSQGCDTVEYHFDTPEHHPTEDTLQDPHQESITATVLADLQAAAKENSTDPLQLREESAILGLLPGNKSNRHELIPGQTYIPLDFEDEF